MVTGTIFVLSLFLQLLICMLFTFPFCFDLLGLGLFNMIYNCLYVAIIVIFSNIHEEIVCYIIFSIMASKTEVPVIVVGSSAGVSAQRRGRATSAGSGRAALERGRAAPLAWRVLAPFPSSFARFLAFSTTMQA